MNPVVAAVLAAWLAAGTASAQDVGVLAPWFASMSLPAPTRFSIIVCHGFACHTRTPITLTDADRAALARFLKGAKDADAERKGIARAVAWFDKRIGPLTGTTGAKAYARGVAGDRTQFDCFDRTTNTATLFSVMAETGALKHHTIAEPASRSFVPFVGRPHTTAVLAERQGGRKWAVDSWTRNHGELPEVMPLDRWLELD